MGRQRHLFLSSAALSLDVVQFMGNSVVSGDIIGMIFGCLFCVLSSSDFSEVTKLAGVGDTRERATMTGYRLGERHRRIGPHA